MDYDTAPITANTATNHLDGAFGPEAAGAGYANQTTVIPPDGNCTIACHATSLTDGRWNDKRKAAIRDSRVFGTSLIASTLAK